MRPILLSNLNSQIPKIDIFITSASFEDRCFSIINALDNAKYDELWVCFNKNEEEFYSNNVEKLMAYKYNPTLLEFSTDDPLITGHAIQEKMTSTNIKNKTILVDITTFTHEGLLILFRFIEIHKSKLHQLFIVYTGASSYDANEPNDDKKWLTKGIKSIRSVLGYPGVLSPARKNHLIILFGFESERTEKLISEFEFERVSLGFGAQNDSIKSEHSKINTARHLNLINHYPGADQFEFSLTDPFLAKEQIINQIDKFPNYNIVIAPMNNKLSTIGAALVALDRNQVQLCYVRAHEYNLSGYSIPSNECFLVNMSE